MRVSIFGLGYVGCVTAACLAKAGHQVIGVDVNPDKVAMVNAGTSPLVEPGLGELLAEATAAGQLRATTSTEEGIAESDLALIRVGTPSRDNGQLDVDAIRRVAEGIGPAALETLHRGSPEHRVAWHHRISARAGSPRNGLFPLSRLDRRGQPGVHARRILAAGLRPASPHPGRGRFAACRRSSPRALRPGRGPFVQTSIRSAEMAKYVSNAFHALMITFANEIGDLCEAFGVDIGDVMRVFLMDRKLNISEAYLRPGFAFGGSCLPKDLRALTHAARTVDLALPLLSQILPSNDRQIQQGVSRVLATRRRRIGVPGLAFKPGTDDLRESPMVLLVETLIGKGCDVRILDRSVSIARLGGANRRYIEEEIPHIASLMCETVDALLAHAEVLVVANSDEHARQALAAARPDHLVIDLSRGTVPKP
jgi:GDP-mannose 6-dehydrogenase